MINILIHILPQEIDQLEQTLIQLKKNSVYVGKDEFLVEVILNNNLTDWDNSILDKNYFETKLFRLEKLAKSWAKTNFWVSNNNEIMGCTDQRRKAAREHDCDGFIFLDVDIVFSDTLLFHIHESFNSIKETYPNCIITPETTRVWDLTWDVITHKECLDDNASLEDYFSRDPYLTTGLMGEVSLKKIDEFKFAGGWATFISKPLAQKVDLPDALGPYYMDDTFIMECCSQGKRKGLKANQFVLMNEVIIENNLFRFNHYENYIKNINRKDEFMKVSQDSFLISINNFLKTL